MPPSEIIFSVQESPEGGYEARAIGFLIFTQAESLDTSATEHHVTIPAHKELK